MNFQTSLPQQYRYLVFNKNYPHMDKINAAIEAQTVHIQRVYRKYAKDQTRDRCKRDGPTPLRTSMY